MTHGASGTPRPDNTVGEIGERRLLSHLRSRIPVAPGVIVGIGDDAAALETGPLTLVTTDALVEGVHFRRDFTPSHLLGRKALSVNLSDIAAMAGVPRYATVSLCLPADVTVEFIDGLYNGLLERAAETGVVIVGGNVSAISGPLIIDITLLGHGDRLLRRSGAQPGDLVVVTGTLGASAAGLRLLEHGARLSADGDLVDVGTFAPSAQNDLLHCLRAQLDPAPPLAFARALSEHEIVHAACDVSDGLSGDLLNLCQESGLAAWIEASAVPVDVCAGNLGSELGADGFSLALHGGEDYQLLMAVPPQALDALKDVAVVWDLAVTPVGEFSEGAPGVSLKFGDALRRLRPKSHEHFRDPERGRRADPDREA
jgi:thiamine-monophosphate kinase